MQFYVLSPSATQDGLEISDTPYTVLIQSPIPYIHRIRVRAASLTIVGEESGSRTQAHQGFSTSLPSLAPTVPVGEGTGMA